MIVHAKLDHKKERAQLIFFWSCPKAREVWVSSVIFYSNPPVQYLIFFDLLWHVIMIKKWDQNSNDIYILVGNLCNIKENLTKYDFFFFKLSFVEV